MTLNECVEALIRDCREPDKVLLNVSSLKRAIVDIRRELEEGNLPEVWNLLYLKDRI